MQHHINNDYSKAKEKFLLFLHECYEKHGTLKDWHAIFSNGTVVRMENIVNLEFYDMWERDYPHHRLLKADFFEKIIKETRETVEKQKLLFGELNNEIMSSYYHLILFGYPLPGTSMADSNIYPIPMKDGDVFSMMYYGGSKYAFNISSDYSDEAHRCARECRRYDYMFPYLDCLVSPDDKITNFI